MHDTKFKVGESVTNPYEVCRHSTSYPRSYHRSYPRSEALKALQAIESVIQLSKECIKTLNNR